MTIQVEILQFLHYNPSSSRVEIAAGLTEAPNERTLKRIIASRDIVLLHRFEGSEKVLYGLIDGLAFPDALFITDY